MFSDSITRYSIAFLKTEGVTKLNSTKAVSSKTLKIQKINSQVLLINDNSKNVCQLRYARLKPLAQMQNLCQGLVTCTCLKSWVSSY